MRGLWTYTSDSKTSDVCSGVDLSSKPKTAVESMMDNIMDKRRSDKPLKKLVDNNNYGDYIISLCPYFIPWAVFFVLSIIGLYRH